MTTIKYTGSLAKARLFAGAGLSALAAVALAAPAMAQDAGAQDAAAQDAAAPADEEAIIVTGSRIRSVTPFNSPDPITVVSPEIAKKEGRLNLAEALQTSPIANGSTQITAALSSNFVTNGGPGAQTIDLRGLGANRTLVLLNGRRAGPAGTRGGVSSFDLNVLPLSIIKDIRIVKTGASSVFGSDAVAGVVNIITEDRADGLTLNANVAAPFDSGGEEYRLSAAWGKKFDRGHITIAGDYSHTNELARGDRSYLGCPEAFIFDEAGNRSDLIDPRTGQPKCEDLRWGHVWTYNLIDNLRLDGPNGEIDGGTQTSLGGRAVLLQYQYATGPGSGALNIPAFGEPGYIGDFAAPAGWFPTGYDAASTAVQNAYHPFVEQQSIIPETDLYTAYAEGAFEISDAVELFGEFLFNRRQTYQNGWRQFWNFGWTGDLYTTGAGNYFNYWGDGWAGINFISPTGITDRSDSSQKVDYYRGVGGLRGDLGGKGDWHYEVYGQYSRNIGRYRTEQILQDVYDSGYFQYSSCVGTILPVSGKQCIDLPWTDPFFLRGELTPEQADFLTDWEEGKTIYTQLTGEASINGNLFELPAGPVAIAAGAAWRRDFINDTPGEITLAANAWGASASGITSGKSITKELFGEISVPILADKPFFQELTLSAAGRVTNVKATRASDGVTDSDNGNWTYKIGLNWQVNDWVRFRGSYGTSYRAPALFEQFLADETGFVSQRLDVCSDYVAANAAGEISDRIAANCAADGIPADYTRGAITLDTLSRGGLGLLKAETSRAGVFGIILTPRLFSDINISLAVDYFNIRVKDEISQLGPANIVFGCYDSEDFANEPLCDFITRDRDPDSPTAFEIQRVIDNFINISTQKNEGIDVAFRADKDIGSLGRLSFTADMTWQLTDDTRLLPTSPLTSDNGEAGSPKWVGDFRATWAHPSGFSLFYGVNVIGATSDLQDFQDRNGGDSCIDSFNPNDGNPVPIYGRYCPDFNASAKFYHNLSVTKEIADGRFEITAGVSNLFDTRPPRVSVLNGGQISTLGPVIAASQYSFVGRRGFINVTAKF